MDFVQQAADRSIEPLNDRQQGFDVGALIGHLAEHLRLLLGEELKRDRGCISHAATLLARILRTADLVAHRASTSQRPLRFAHHAYFCQPPHAVSRPRPGPLCKLAVAPYRLQGALALGRITPLVAAVVRATHSPNHDRYGESPVQAGRAVAADLPSDMGGEASRASGSTPEAVAGQSRAGSTPRITRTNQSCFVSANADSASSTSQHSGDQTSSRA